MAKKNKQEITQNEATNAQPETSQSEELVLNLTDKYKKHVS